MGLEELFALAGALVAAELACVGVLAGRRLLPQATRQVRAALVPVGRPASVAVRSFNTGVGPTSAAVLQSTMEFLAYPPQPREPRQPGATARVPALPPGHSAETHLPLATDRRGVWVLGPLQSMVSDPLGLFVRSATVAPAVHLVVHPRLTPLAPLPVPALPAGGDTLSARAAPAIGGDLRSLRDYQPGDDARRVHWRTTARLGRLVVREDEAPSGMAVAMAVDLRGLGDAGGPLEQCLEAAASIAHAVLAAEGTTLHLATTAGDIAAPGRGPVTRAEVMEVLALATGHRPGATRLHWPLSADLALIVSPSEEAALELLRGSPPPGRPLLVVTGAEREPSHQPALAGVAVVRAGTGLAGAWARALPLVAHGRR